MNEVSQILKSMRVPLRYQSFTFNDYDTGYNHDEIEVDEMKELADIQGWALVRSPITARGKSRLVVALMYRSWEKNHTDDWNQAQRWSEDKGKYIYVPYPPSSVSDYLYIDLSVESERLWHLGTEREKVFDKWLSKKCVVFDEFVNLRDEMRVLVENIIGKMFLDMKQVIIASPLNKDAWGRIVNGRITRRIKDCGKIFDLTGKGYS